MTISFLFCLYLKLGLRRLAPLPSTHPSYRVSKTSTSFILNLSPTYKIAAIEQQLEKCRLATCSCLRYPPAAAAAAVKYQKYMRSPGEITFRSDHTGSFLVVNLQKRPNLTLSWNGNYKNDLRVR